MAEYHGQYYVARTMSGKSWTSPCPEVATKKRRIEVKNKDEEIEQQKLPDELWSKVLDSVDDTSVSAFACTCKQLRRVQEESGRKLETNLENYRCLGGNEFWCRRTLRTRSEAWCLWSWSLTSTGDEKVRSSIIRVAAYWGHLSALKLFTQESGKRYLTTGLFCYAAEGGQLDVVVWLKSEGCAWDNKMCVVAAQEGHLDLLKYARAHGCPCDEWICASAAKGGQLHDDCQWPTPGQLLSLVAAGEGQFKVLKWLTEERLCILEEQTFAYAASAGSMEMLRWLKDQECPWDSLACNGAASLEVLQWLRSNGCPWDGYTIEFSAARGQLEQLKWAHEQGGAPLCLDTFIEAAAGGHIEVLSWLRAQGCPWDETVCAAAKEVEVIRWLHEHGCSWDERTTLITIYGFSSWCFHRLDVVKWAIEHGCPWDPEATRKGAISISHDIGIQHRFDKRPLSKQETIELTKWEEFIKWIDGLGIL